MSLRQLLTGLGIVGSLVVAAGMTSSAHQPASFEMLSPSDNDTLRRVPELHDVVQMLRDYAVLDKQLVEDITTQCVALAGYSNHPATIANVRIIDKTTHTIKSKMRRLRKRVKTQSHGNADVLRVFAEVVDAATDACESQSLSVLHRL